MKNLKECMATSIQSCKEDESIRNVSQQMSRANVGFIPVVDGNQKIVGVITDRDIAMAISKSSKPIEQIKAREIMNKQVHAVHVDDDASKALEMMKAKQIGRLPVVDSENRLKGVINLPRIARHHRTNEQGDGKGREVMDAIYSIADRKRSKA